jgi:hypothetical protein
MPKKAEEEDVFEQMKKKNASTTGAGQRSYQFNQRAYKKYHSTRTLLERILKSHSEGNRFIRNEDL